MNTQSISVLDSKILLTLFGPRDQYLRNIRKALGVTITAREDRIHIEGEAAAVAQATAVLEQLKSLAERRGQLDSHEVAAALSAVTGKTNEHDHAPIQGLSASRQVRPRTPGQAAYVQAIQEHDLVFCVGPAGSGKTYLAVATAVSAFRREQVRKIVLVRPAVEAGESLGYLPGDLQAKINPYLRPLLDALRELLDYDLVKRLSEQDVIEMVPLAYMRGRTLNDAFIILDEAQNTTISQMKMFLTRMGNNSKIVVSGDTTQIDLPPHTPSGLIDALGRLRGLPGVAEIRLEKTDIVRHKLVQAIVEAYAEDDAQLHQTVRRRKA
ncbi:MAG: PhoH family protein [Pirellulales bacterium]|nr:PhoH family protein [Pirellulales bacterium]